MLSFNINLSLYAPSPNRAYLASAIAYAKIPLWGTKYEVYSIRTAKDLKMRKFPIVLSCCL